MAPLRGVGAVRRAAHTKVRTAAGKTTTFLAALRPTASPRRGCFDGPIDGESFSNLCREGLLPTLRAGDIVIMDNLGSHKGKAVRALIARPAPSSSSAKILTRLNRSNRSSPNSSICCARRPRLVENDLRCYRRYSLQAFTREEWRQLTSGTQAMRNPKNHHALRQ